MNHDPMCPVNQYIGFPDPFGLASRAECRCALIAKVREDMLAKCIETAVKVYRNAPEGYSDNEAAELAFAALRALLDNQDNI